MLVCYNQERELIMAKIVSFSDSISIHTIIIFLSYYICF